MRLTTPRAAAPPPRVVAAATGGLTDPMQRHRLTDPLQRKTVINNVGQTYNYATGTATVGKSMEAWLDPDDPRQGWSAGVNNAQDSMMSAIRDLWGIDGSDLVKGHLLNDNLGGTALGENLYPITRGANKDHEIFAENAVKKRLWGDKLGMYYRVDVKGTPDIFDNVAYFDCVFKEWDTDDPGDTTGKDVIPAITVFSDLNSVRTTKNVWTMGKVGEPSRTKRTKKPVDFKAPKTRVGDLTKKEKKRRKLDL